VKHFVALFEALDVTTSTTRKVEALAAYFQAVPPGDAAWALTFLTGRRLKRHLPVGLLATWAAEVSGTPAALFSECASEVGDLAEVCALLLDGTPRRPAPELTLCSWMEERVLPLKGMDEVAQRDAVLSWWRTLERRGVFVLCKLLTGEFRVGVAETLVLRALAQVAGLPVPTVAHRLMGTWKPSAEAFAALLAPDAAVATSVQPYPFSLASPFEDDIATLGDPAEWLAEWKWDGIRAQLLRRPGEVHLWSRGEEQITARFPEITRAAEVLPAGTAIDGEILAWTGSKALPFAQLQRRIGRVALEPRVLGEAPAVLMAFDLLEDAGQDVRDRPLRDRRARLTELLSDAPPALRMSEALTGSWTTLAAQREQARTHGVEGLMLKRRDSPYVGGRKRGVWWKWKIAPFSVDAVLIYAQPGSGRRARLLTDFTFGVWSGEALVPIAKAYSGLTDVENAALDTWIRAHTLEQFGPVRRVVPELVFEIAFENIALSNRHKSGVAVRFQRILRQRTDKRPADADHLEKILELLRQREARDAQR
jgi:DNA ligase-1